MDYDYTTYKVEFINEVKSSSPATATRNTLHRIFREEIEAKVTTQAVVDALKEKDKAQALIKAFVEWGYEFEKTTDGIELVCREMSKWGDDEHLWNAVAPVLDHNHYIKWRGEDDHYWQYKFANGTLNEGSGHLVWEE